MVLYQVCSNDDPRVQNGPAPGVLSLKQRKIFKNVFLENYSAHMLEIWYVALLSNFLLSLFK